MPYKNDNLDELFQNAAEDYPLNTSNSNWNRVAAKLNVISAEKSVVKSYSFLKYAVICLLLLGGSLMVYKYKFGPQTDINNQVTSNKKAETNGSNQQAGNSKNSESGKNLANNLALTEDMSFQHQNPKHIRDINLQNIIQKNQAPLNMGLNDDNAKKHNDNSTDGSATVATVSTNDISSQEKSFTNEKITAKNNGAVSDNSNSVTSVKQTIKLSAKTSRFYGSLYGGPELSSVKYQRITKTGYQLGVALGYRINDRFDIEIGLQREHINYYTNGKYFQKSGLKLQAPTDLENVNGNSKVTSIPLTLKYNFLSHSQGHFYVAGGVDAMLLTHTENYNYVTLRNGDENDRSKRYSSVTGPKYFTSFNVSGGYETKLTNWCNIKVEPYYQLPLSNIGVGKVPVTSFGINIGIVKDLK